MKKMAKKAIAWRGAMICLVENEIVIQDIEPKLLEYFEKNLVFANPEFAKKERMGLWTGNTPRTISLIWKRGNHVGVPFGMLEVIGRHRDMFSNIINRVSRPVGYINYNSSIHLYDYQREAVEAAQKKRNGVIVAPCGSGKTQMGLELVARIGGRALWLTHTTELLNQSMERAKAVLGLPETEYGTITAGKVNVGKAITFATVQTMNKMDLSIVKNAFDVIIVDEAHHCVGSPSKVQMFYKVISALTARYKFGLTATPTRQDGLIGCMYALLGSEIYRVSKKQVQDNLCPVQVRIINTNYTPDIGVVLSSDGTLQYTSLINDIVGNRERNEQIIGDVIKYGSGKRSLVLTDRVSHAKEIHDMLKAAGINPGLLVGKVSKSDRKNAIGAILDGSVMVLVATYAIAKEGLDIPPLNNVFFTTPKKDPTTVIQSAGRVARKFPGKNLGFVYDYEDNFGMLRGWRKKRCGFYEKEGFLIEYPT